MKLFCGIVAFTCILALGQAAPAIYNPYYDYKEAFNDQLNELLQQNLLDSSAQVYLPPNRRIIHYEKMLKQLKELAQQESEASEQRMLPYYMRPMTDTKSDQEADQQEKMAHEEKWKNLLNTALRVAPLVVG